MRIKGSYRSDRLLITVIWCTVVMCGAAYASFPPNAMGGLAASIPQFNKGTMDLGNLIGAGNAANATLAGAQVAAKAKGDDAQLASKAQDKFSKAADGTHDSRKCLQETCAYAAKKLAAGKAADNFKRASAALAPMLKRAMKNMYAGNSRQLALNTLIADMKKMGYLDAAAYKNSGDVASGGGGGDNGNAALVAANSGCTPAMPKMEMKDGRPVMPTGKLSANEECFRSQFMVAALKRLAKEQEIPSYAPGDLDGNVKLANYLISEAADNNPDIDKLARNTKVTSKSGSDPQIQAIYKAGQEVAKAMGSNGTNELADNDIEKGSGGDGVSLAAVSEAHNRAAATSGDYWKTAIEANAKTPEAMVADIDNGTVAMAGSDAGSGSGGGNEQVAYFDVSGGASSTAKLYVPPKTLVSGLSLKELFGQPTETMVSLNTR
jgi:hypothetical protein